MDQEPYKLQAIDLLYYCAMFLGAQMRWGNNLELAVAEMAAPRSKLSFQSSWCPAGLLSPSVACMVLVGGISASELSEEIDRRWARMLIIQATLLAPIAVNFVFLYQSKSSPVALFPHKMWSLQFVWFIYLMHNIIEDMPLLQASAIKDI